MRRPGKGPPGKLLNTGLRKKLKHQLNYIKLYGKVITNRPTGQ